MSASAGAVVTSIGFSTSRCRQCAAAAMPCSAWSPDGVPTTTMSSGRCASIRSRESNAAPPCRAANCSARSRTGAKIAAISTAGIPRSARACVSLMLPAPITPTWIVTGVTAPHDSQRSGFLQQLLHTGKALAARRLGRSRAAPMCFERHCMPIAVVLQRAELANPVDDASPHRRPLPAAARFANGVLAVHVADASLRDRGVAPGKRRLVSELRVAGIPRDLERLVRNRGEQPPGFGACRGVAGVLVLEDEHDVLFRRFRRSPSHDVVDRRAVRLLIIEP